MKTAGRLLPQSAMCLSKVMEITLWLYNFYIIMISDVAMKRLSQLSPVKSDKKGKEKYYLMFIVMII